MDNENNPKTFKQRFIMKKYRLTALILFIPIIFIGCTQDNSDRKEVEKDIQAIKEMSSERAEAFRNGDAAGIAIHFSENSILMAPGNHSFDGRDAVRDYYQSIFDQYETDLESYYEEVEVSCEIAYGRGFAEVTLTSKDSGDTEVSTSKYINILKRQSDGSWITTHDIWNSND